MWIYVFPFLPCPSSLCFTVIVQLISTGVVNSQPHWSYVELNLKLHVIISETHLIPISHFNSVNRKKHILFNRVVSVLQRCEIRFCRLNGVIMHTDLISTLLIFKVLAGGVLGGINHNCIYTCICVYTYIHDGRELRRWSQSLWNDKRYRTQILTQENLFKCLRKIFLFVWLACFCYKCRQTQVVQRGWRISILEDAQNLTWHVPKQPAVGETALSREVWPDNLLKHLRTSSILWLAMLKYSTSYFFDPDSYLCGCLVGDVIVGGHLGHSDHKMSFQFLEKYGGGRWRCYLELPEGKLRPV